MMRAKKTSNGRLLMLCVFGCLCLLLSWPLTLNKSVKPLSSDITNAIAREYLPAGTVINMELFEKNFIEIEMVSRDETPEVPLPNIPQIFGCVLAVPVVQGQVLTESCFVTEGIGEKPASQIPQRMKIVTVPVSDRTMPDKSLLYPGCFVVTATFKLKKSRIPDIIPDFIVNALIKCKLIKNSGLPVFTWVGGRYQVLSVKHGVRGTFVTLLVPEEQSERLSSAMKNGPISLIVLNSSSSQTPKTPPNQ